jgi:hypothetical protein
MLETLITFHLWLRWAVVLFGLVGAARLLVARGSGEMISRSRRFDARFFTAALDLNWAIGIVLLILTWAYEPPGPRILHGAVMTLAVVAAHVLAVRSRRQPDRDYLLALSFLLPLLIVVLGHLLLPS